MPDLQRRASSGRPAYVEEFCEEAQSTIPNTKSTAELGVKSEDAFSSYRHENGRPDRTDASNLDEKGLKHARELLSTSTLDTTDSSLNEKLLIAQDNAVRAASNTQHASSSSRDKRDHSRRNSRSITTEQGRSPTFRRNREYSSSPKERSWKLVETPANYERRPSDQDYPIMTRQISHESAARNRRRSPVAVEQAHTFPDHSASPSRQLVRIRGRPSSFHHAPEPSYQYIHKRNPSQANQQITIHDPYVHEVHENPVLVPYAQHQYMTSPMYRSSSNPNQSLVPYNQPTESPAYKAIFNAQGQLLGYVHPSYVHAAEEGFQPENCAPQPAFQNRELPPIEYIATPRTARSLAKSTDRRSFDLRNSDQSIPNALDQSIAHRHQGSVSPRDLRDLPGSSAPRSPRENYFDQSAELPLASSPRQRESDSYVSGLRSPNRSPAGKASSRPTSILMSRENGSGSRRSSMAQSPRALDDDRVVKFQDTRHRSDRADRHRHEDPLQLAPAPLLGLGVDSSIVNHDVKTPSSRTSLERLEYSVEAYQASCVERMSRLAISHSPPIGKALYDSSPVDSSRRSSLIAPGTYEASDGTQRRSGSDRSDQSHKISEIAVTKTTSTSVASRPLEGSKPRSSRVIGQSRHDQIRDAHSSDNISPGVHLRSPSATGSYRVEHRVVKSETDQHNRIFSHDKLSPQLSPKPFSPKSMERNLGHKYVDIEGNQNHETPSTVTRYEYKDDNRVCPITNTTFSPNHSLAPPTEHDPTASLRIRPRLPQSRHTYSETDSVYRNHELPNTHRAHDATKLYYNERSTTVVRTRMPSRDNKV